MKLLDKLLNNKLIQQISTLVTGSLIAQIIGFAVTPILSRLYLPEDFGFFGSLMTLAGIISVALTFKYEMAIILTKKKIETEGVVRLSLVVLFSLFLVLTCVLSFKPILLTHLGLSSSSLLIVFLLLSIVLFQSLQNVFIQWHSKLENYNVISKNRVVQKSVIIIVQLNAIYFFSNHFGLIIGFLTGLIISLILLIHPFIRDWYSIRFNKKYLRVLSLKYYRFPLYTAPQSLLNSISQGLPILMLGYYFDLRIVGLYFFAVRILEIPSTMIGGSIRQVFYKRASDLRDNLTLLRAEFNKITLGLLALISLPAITLFVFGPQIFSWCFGSEWYEAGLMAKWMILWVSISFVNPPANVVLLALNKNSYQLILDIFLLTFRILALYFGGLSGDIIYTIKLYSLVGLVLNSALILSSYYYLRNVYNNPS